MRNLRRVKSLAFSATFLLVSALLMPLFSQPVLAQATTGGLRGVVSDKAGAVVPDADVTAKNSATGVESRTKTNDEGIYSFPSLLPGSYLVVVEKQGFKKAELQEVIVKVGDIATIDPTLEAGLGTETVTITAGESLIQKEQVQISNTFEARKVADLPSNVAGGGIDTLALLAPGVVPGFGNVNGNGTTLSVNGNRARSNNFTVDGADNNDLSIGGPNYFVDNQDIVAEFQVITNNFSAEYGRNQGAIVNIVTKAGTNDFHGTLFWAHRDRKNFDSLTNFERRGGDKDDPTPFLYNVYSGTAGGRIIKDKLFFFGSWQTITGREVGLFQSANPAIAPEDLSRFAADFPGNPIAQAIANFSAFAITDIGTLRERADLPNDGTFTIGGNVYRAAFPEREVALPFTQKEFSARADWTINDRHGLWFRQLYQTVDNKNALSSPGSGGFFSDIPVTSKISTGQFTSQLTSTSVNAFRFNFNRLSVIFGGGCEGKQGCIPHPDAIGDTLANITFTGFRDSNGNNMQTIGPATNLPQGRVVDVYQFNDDYSKTLGKHQLKIGADIRRLKNTVPFLPNVNGAFRFPSSTAIVQNRPSFVNLASGEVAIGYKETDQFYYINDDFRVRDNLTLNLGVRYEYIGQPINTLHELSLERESDPSTALWKQSLPLEVRTFGKLPADKNNFAPRFGFAWRPRFGDGAFSKMLLGESDATVIRGGYSIAYDPPFYNLLLNISTSSPLVFLNTTLNPASPAAVAFPLPSASPTGAEVQAFAQGAGLIAKDTFDPRFFSQTQVSKNFYLPYAQQFSFGIQRELNRENVVEARWVATKGTGLFQTLNRNPRIDRLLNGFTRNVLFDSGDPDNPNVVPVTFPGFPQLLPQGLTPQVAGVGACVDDPNTPAGILNEANACNGRLLPQSLIRSRENTVNSIYHSLQTRYQGRLVNQLSLGVSYTWSKALDNASEVFSFQEASATQNPFNTNSLERGFSGFDRRHALSMNFIWDVPLFKNQEGLVGNLLGGWQLNGTYFLANGLRYTPSQFLNVFGIGSVGYDDTVWDGGFLGLDSLRPFFGNPNAPRTEVGISQVDAALIFGVPVQNIDGFWSLNQLQGNGNLVNVTKDQVRYIFNGPGAARIFNSPFGTVPRGQEIGMKLNNLNLGIFKTFRIRENMKIRFSVDMFNALNHPNPGVGFIANETSAVPDIFVDDAGTSTPFGDFTEVQLARRAIQFGLKFIF
ncbi:MAG: carboxypeptidase regulatory-like domain-containing protein [Blastocatellia bacterium]